MSTNFYWQKNIDIPVEILPKKIKPFAQRVKDACRTPYDDEQILVHIGKRSNAGFYCYDCGTTLFKEGTKQLHQNYNSEPFFATCPVCGTERPQDLNQPISCIQGTCSFTWTVMAHLWLMKALTKPEVALALKLAGAEYVIKNEYGMVFTAKEMIKELKDIHIYFQSPYKFS